jgi:excisionase family DNA binding protein
MADPSKTDRMIVTLTESELEAIIERAVEKTRTPTELLTPEELAEKLRIPVSWVYEQSRQNQIPTRRLGRYIRFDLREVLESQAYQKKNQG